MTTTPAKPAPLFEHDTCRRCGGSGHFSFNLIHGSVCYGCSGTSYQLTKRGAAAQAYFRELCSVPVGELRVGDTVRAGGLTGAAQVFEYWAKVVEIRPSTVKMICNGAEVVGLLDVVTEHAKFGRTTITQQATAKIRKGYTAEQKAPLIARALEFQSTLTKTGRPTKRGK